MNNVDLTELRCLQFLGVGFHTLDQWENLASLLKDTPLMQTLKYLSIYSFERSGPSDWQDLTGVWKDLDLVLSSAFALRKVYVYAHSPAQLEGSGGVRESMPLLEDRGILTFEEEDLYNTYSEHNRFADSWF